MKLLPTLLLALSTSLMACKAQFLNYAPETNQPNCVVGAFTMYAKETLNVELSPWLIQSNSPVIDYKGNKGMYVEDILPTWNKLFPTNKLERVYSVTDTNGLNVEVSFNRPYVWVGLSEQFTNRYHCCLVYLHTNDVTYKHFVYWPVTHTNYMVNRSYEYFFSNTVALYDLQ